ncbi:hypothetical protein EV702DRAFT_1197482 [Suillus placidus]|uniref:Myb-like domain-containing protein n=1 Tax=Suillus placidus TaxID=48579 RepID=A0A9P6ZVE2_9AGAM|nr:hypothetical protein EV702DRAFT_1197482 [Suillus placidus]
MPPKSMQAPKKPRRKQPQNSRQVRRPARGSNKNPCLNNDESQVGHPSEQTNDPMLVDDRLSLAMYEEEMNLSDEDAQYEEDGLEVERLPSSPCNQHPPFLQPTHQQPQGLPPNHYRYSMPRQSSNPLLQNRQLYQQLPAHQPQGDHVFQRSINTPPPPTVRGAERLGNRLCDDQRLMEYQQPPVREAHPHYSTLGQSSNPLQHQQPYQQPPVHQPHMFRCSINVPPPPTVRGAEHLSGCLRDEQTRPARMSPYPLPGLRKVSVFGPRHIDKSYRGQWQNTGIIYAGADKNVAPKRPTARDIPPTPSAPSDITIPVFPVQTNPPSHPVQSSNASHDTGSSHPVPPQQQEPIPVPAELVKEICASARSKMRRAVLSDNGMPTHEENVAMARAALSNSIATHASIPPGRYYLPDEDEFITSLTKITNTLRNVLKNTAHTVVLFAYDLELDIWDTSCEITHKQNIVPTLITHLQCLFKLREMMIGGVLQNVPVLEHTALIRVVMDILWVNGFYKDIDLQDPQSLDGVIALAVRYSFRFHPTMTKGKGKKKAAADSQETITAAKDRCIWSLDDERKLMEYAVQHHAKGGNGMNFTKSFWVGAAAEMATRPCPEGAPKTPEACQSKWTRIRKMYQVVDKIASHASGLSFHPELGANISEESETMWADFIKHNPSAKPLRNKGWSHYEALRGIIPTHTSSWVGFHASTSLTTNASTPTATGSDITQTTTADPPGEIMSSLEHALHQVEFRDLDLDDVDMRTTPIPNEIPPVPAPILPIPAPITPVTPRGFNAAMQHFVAPSISTPGSSTAVKRKADGDDSERYGSRPPHSSKAKSASGSSKSQCLTLPLALEGLGDKMVGGIASASSTLQDVVTAHIMEPIPSRKQRAMLQVQEEKDLDDYDAVAMMGLFQADVTITDAYNSITRDGIRKIFLAQHLKESRRVRTNEQQLL